MRATFSPDAWHPTRQTAAFVEEHLPYLRYAAERQGRTPDGLTISLKRSLHFTDIGLSGEVLSHSNNALIGSTQEVIDDVCRCRDTGMQQLTFDFRTGHMDEIVHIMEHFAAAVVPAVQA
jgi:hypothetical protein